MALLPFGPIDVVAVRALPVAERVGVAGRLLWWLHRRRRRRLLYRGHGRTRRLTVRAAAAVVPRLVGIVDAVAVLRAVDDAHVVVSYPARVLAVFIITRAAAVLHRCSHRDSAGALLGVGSAGWFCAATGEEGTSAAMEDECGSGGSARRATASFCVRAQPSELASCETLASKQPVAVDAVA